MPIRDKIANFAVKVSDDLVALKAKKATIYLEPSLKESLTHGNHSFLIIIEIVSWFHLYRGCWYSC